MGQELCDQNRSLQRDPGGEAKKIDLHNEDGPNYVGSEPPYLEPTLPVFGCEMLQFAPTKVLPACPEGPSHGIWARCSVSKGRSSITNSSLCSDINNLRTFVPVDSIVNPILSPVTWVNAVN
jgi:hypothetical protein